MPLLKKLFGFGNNSAAAPAKETAPEIYKGYTIQPAPVEEGGAFQVRGLITKDIDGERKEHHFIRADRLPSREIAEAMILSKARQMIDQLGERIFRDS